MRRGNLSRDKQTFSWKAEGGVRKTHLGRNDIFVQVSMSGDEFILQRKGRVDQFLLIDSRGSRAIHPKMSFRHVFRASGAGVASN